MAVAPEAEIRTTACPLDCPDTCSLSVAVEAGRLVGVDAGPGNPLTDGFICQKVKHHAPGLRARTGAHSARAYRSEGFG